MDLEIPDDAVRKSASDLGQARDHRLHLRVDIAGYRRDETGIRHKE
jgi:hypothetical protein